MWGCMGVAGVGGDWWLWFPQSFLFLQMLA